MIGITGIRGSLPPTKPISNTVALQAAPLSDPANVGAPAIGQRQHLVIPRRGLAESISSPAPFAPA